MGDLGCTDGPQRMVINLNTAYHTTYSAFDSRGFNQQSCCIWFDLRSHHLTLSANQIGWRLHHAVVCCTIYQLAPLLSSDLASQYSFAYVEQPTSCTYLTSSSTIMTVVDYPDGLSLQFNESSRVLRYVSEILGNVLPLGVSSYQSYLTVKHRWAEHARR